MCGAPVRLTLLRIRVRFIIVLLCGIGSMFSTLRRKCTACLVPPSLSQMAATKRRPSACGKVKKMRFAP
jgi:hypothetical protein